MSEENEALARKFFRMLESGDHGKADEIVAHWECDKDNIGLVREAEKVGFEKTEETVFWSGEFLR